MKNNVRILLVFCGLLLSGGLYAQVGIGTNQPDKSAALDILSSSRGLLIPRIDLGDADDISMMASAPITSLLVYNNNADATGLEAGFYFWDSSISTAGEWVRFKDSSQLLLAENGLEIDNTDPNNPKVILGGKLTKATIIDFQDTAGTQQSLAFTNMTAADAANKIVVAEETTGELHTVTRSLYQVVSASIDIDDPTTGVTDYSSYVQEIYLEVDVSALVSNIDITLPDPANAEGQEINIKITDTGGVGEAAAYLNILANGGATITYGALPYQAWVLKSSGGAWRVVSRN